MCVGVGVAGTEQKYMEGRQDDSWTRNITTERNGGNASGGSGN